MSVPVYSRIGFSQQRLLRKNKLNGNWQTFVLSLWLLCSFCGCDDSPSYNAAQSNRNNKTRLGMTTENGRGGYEWKLNQQGQFAVPIPPMFTFLTELPSHPK